MNDLDPKQQQRPRAQTKQNKTNELGEVATLFGVRFDTAHFDEKIALRELL